MNKIGTLDIIKAYLGTRELTSNNAYIGEISLIKGSGPTPVPIPNDEIWYTTTDDRIYDLGGIIRTLVAMGATYNGPAVVSNEYDEETQMWHMAFDDDVAVLGDLNPNTLTDEGPFFVTYPEMGLNCNVETIIIPDSVTRIGVFAFRGCSGLTSITIPNNVTNIGEYAFFGCTNLVSATISNSVTSIGNYAFQDCSSLASITIPDSVTSIGVWAFNGCRGLTSVTIGNSVTSIGDAAFYYCTSLASVMIGNSVATIGSSAFGVCIGLTSISYAGTIAQYNAITKGTSWHNSVPATVVHCTDGDTPI